MIASSLIGVLCGLLLGSRFKVLAIVVAHFMALILTIPFVVWSNGSFSQALLGLLCWSVALQFGYVTMIVAGSRAGRTMSAKTFEA